ncbi:hypothetical protein RSOL_174790, partial [Rhizoctonia solani AG-3 Rhs1AP]
MDNESHISGSCGSEHSMRELREFTATGARSPIGSVVSSSVIDEHSAINDRIAVQKRRFNQAARIIEETAAREIALAADFVAELKVHFPEDAEEFDDSLAAETIEIRARAASELDAEAEKLHIRVWEIHTGRKPSD